MALIDDGSAPLPLYNEDLRAEIQTKIGDTPKAIVHREEWKKILAGANSRARCGPCLKRLLA